MKITLKSGTLLFTILAACVITSCNNRNDKMEQKERREEAKVGKVFDPERQGIDQETRDDQFPSSRNDNREGTGLETGAPTDTTTVTETNQ